MKTFFRVVSFLEGTSYLLLLFVAVPIKYWMNDPQYVKLLGMPHGLLFVGWSAKNFGVILLASILPFGTFYVDKKYLR